MRASRLVSLVLLLQARRRCTAGELAAELGVTPRTIYRDLAELTAAGVPVYGLAGRGGGFSLVDGYQTRLTGLTAAEAEALLLVDVIGPLGALGLDAELSSARLKLAAAMPARVRDRAQSVAGWVHLDLPGWFEEAAMPLCLPALAEAVLGSRRARFSYPAPGGPYERAVEPLGLVFKGRSWYLVARHGQRLVSYAAERIMAPIVTGETFDRPDGFNLAETWHQITTEFEQGLPLVWVRVRVSRDAVARLRRIVDTRCTEVDWTGEADSDGWLVLHVGFERLAYAQHGLLSLGGAVEVLEPQQLRANLAVQARALADIYRAD